ncbi:helix-turn-helix transcriptional regulator [Rummeliibacillus pycnus]|uniref:helix-turn-helix transcriptional regulator n=1 Tax=Rummeliibacillus pycnus TaxID=101070 RepID=UPI0037C84CCC
MELESRLKKLRELHQYSQEDVARILDISRQSVSKWELGKGYPDLDNLIRHFGILCITIGGLFFPF